MNTASMTNRQDGSAQWAMAAGEVVRLSIGPGGRELQAVAGWLWLTTEGTADHPADDVWLRPGERLALAAGSNWVIEARTTGRFQLLVPPQRQPWRAPASAVSRWLRSLGARPAGGLQA